MLEKYDNKGRQLIDIVSFSCRIFAVVSNQSVLTMFKMLASPNIQNVRTILSIVSKLTGRLKNI